MHSMTPQPEIAAARCRHRRGAWRLLASALLALALASGLLTATSPANAQASYPSRPIHMVVGFPPGGSNDMVARILAPRLGELLGTSVVIENRPGANAIIGTEYTARAAPDGYTVTLGSASPLAISPHTYSNMPVDPLKDLVVVTTVAATPELIAVNLKKANVKTLPELVALAKTRDVTLASSGNGGLPHLAIELLKTTSQGRFIHVRRSRIRWGATSTASSWTFRRYTAWSRTVNCKPSP